MTCVGPKLLHENTDVFDRTQICCHLINSKGDVMMCVPPKLIYDDATVRASHTHNNVS